MLGTLFAIFGRLCGVRSPTGVGRQLAARSIRTTGVAAHHCASTLIRGMAMHRLAQRAAQNPWQPEDGEGAGSCRFPAKTDPMGRSGRLMVHYGRLSSGGCYGSEWL